MHCPLPSPTTQSRDGTDSGMLIETLSKNHFRIRSSFGEILPTTDTRAWSV